MTKSRSTKNRSKKARAAKRRPTEPRPGTSRAADPAPRKLRLRVLIFSAITAAVFLAAIGPRLGILPADTAPEPIRPSLQGAIQFTDVAAQSREFMSYYKSIKLTSVEERVKRRALEGMHAACCSDFSAYTCCCECNLSRTVWGLANYLIAEKGYGANRVSATVSDWLEFVNPSGFGGGACFEGGCGRPFHNDGCGGMNESELVLSPSTP